MNREDEKPIDGRDKVLLFVDMLTSVSHPRLKFARKAKTLKGRH